ncbi:hypothetical protein Efla_000268 [Eimeria flavescens]
MQAAAKRKTAAAAACRASTLSHRHCTLHGPLQQQQLPRQQASEPAAAAASTNKAHSRGPEGRSKPADKEASCWGRGPPRQQSQTERRGKEVMKRAADGQQRERALGCYSREASATVQPLSLLLKGSMPACGCRGLRASEARKAASAAKQEEGAAASAMKQREEKMRLSQATKAEHTTALLALADEEEEGGRLALEAFKIRSVERSKICRQKPLGFLKHDGARAGATVNGRSSTMQRRVNKRGFKLV